MPSIYDFEAESISGQPVSLAQYRGKAMLVVNTASACGFTPQFAGLEKLHQAYGPQVSDPLYVLLGPERGYVPFYGEYPGEVAAGKRPLG